MKPVSKTAIHVDRDQQILSRIGQIEHRVDSIDQTQAFSLRADHDKHFAVVEKIFNKSKRRAQIYLAADGTRSVEEIAKHLGVKRPNVSRELAILHYEGMLEKAYSIGNRDIWKRKAIDRTLRISRSLMEEFGLGVDGTPTGAAKKRKKGK